MSVNVSRAAQVRTGVRIEVFTVIWMVIEAAVSIGAGILAGSALLTAFGLDSVIELLSGAILLRRLLEEAKEGNTQRVERAEHRAAWIVGLALNALFHWWWAEGIAALVFLFWLIGETREAFAEARESKEADED